MMNFRSPLLRTFATVAIAASWHSGQAQEFIPDTLVRNWLNGEIPGIVNSSGIMDTLHPGIASLDSTTLIFSPPFEATSFDLHGIQYLDSLRWFTVGSVLSTPTTMSCDGLPPNLKILIVVSNTGTIILPQLPEGMERFVASGAPDSVALHIAGLPDSIPQIWLMNIASMHWPVGGHTDALSLSYEQLMQPTVFLPAIDVGTVSISQGSLLGLDLSMVTTLSLVVSNSALNGPVAWPSELESLNISAWEISGDLGSFPASLGSLSIDCGSEYCLPWLPDNLNSLNLTGAIVCLPNWPSALQSAYINWEALDEQNAHYCSTLNSACPGSNPGISGRIFLDTDLNGQYDAGEPPLPQASIVLQPNNNVVGCESDGTWEIGVLPGSYVIAPSSTYPYIQSFSPTEHSANVPNMGDADTMNNFAVTLIPNIEDLRAYLWAEPARPGFDNRLYLTCQNYGTVPMDAQLTLEYDGDQTWVGSSSLPSTQSGNTATWNLTGMGIGTSQMITVDLNTAVGTPLGTPIAHALSALPTSDDETPSDNVVAYIDSVVGSYDPNDKMFTPARMSPTQIQTGETPITYTIRFQNTGTYMAERVLILDTLPAGLQVQSIQFLGSSHPCSWYVLEGVLHVIHEGINLPDSTSDEANSHGFIRFSILPDTDLVDGTEIVNIAHIVFDFNEPIVTPPATFHVDVLASVPEQTAAGVQVHPNPVHERLWITLAPNDHAQVGYVVQDLFGRSVLTGRTSSNGLIDVSELSSGVFMLTTNSNDGKFSTRFVKQ